MVKLMVQEHHKLVAQISKHISLKSYFADTVCSSCFKCGEEGHFSNACPGGNTEAPARSSSRGRGKTRGRGKSRGKSSTRGRRGERGAASRSNKRTFAALDED